jgi:hypothetical protein
LVLGPSRFAARYTLRDLQKTISRHLTGQHGCRALTVAYPDEDGDRQMAVNVNLVGMGRHGFGYGPSDGGLKLTD